MVDVDAGSRNVKVATVCRHQLFARAKMVWQPMFLVMS
jgi:hypothetical protein